MDPELQEVKALRRRLGLTQQQLANAARVSQSLVAKVEAGLVEPSFSAGKRILEALRSFTREQEPTAKELMQRHVVTVKRDEPLKKAIRKMKERAISQLPVVDEKIVVGLLTEKGIVQHMGRVQKTTLVGEVMEEAPPIVTPAAPRKVVQELLSHYSLVLVKDRGKVRGIITKADLLQAF